MQKLEALLWKDIEGPNSADNLIFHSIQHHCLHQYSVR